MSRRVRKARSRQAPGGFTLLELLVATLLSAIVATILAQAMGFGLRMFEAKVGRETSSLPLLADMLAEQAGTLFYAEAPGLTTQALFRGGPRGLCLTTGRSARALTAGGPVIARWLFREDEKRLYYAETPFAPGRVEDMNFFATADVAQIGLERFTVVELEDFQLFYVTGEGGQESWEPTDRRPDVLTVRLAGKNGESLTRAARPGWLDFQARSQVWALGPRTRAR